MEYEGFAIKCDTKDITCKVNQNEIPDFHFPLPLSTYPTSETETTSTPDLITTITDSITTVWNNIIETSASAISNTNVTTSTSTENVIRATISDIIPLEQNNTMIINEDTDSKNIGMVGMIENVSNSSFVEIMQNGSMFNNTNNIGLTGNGSNSSLVDIIQNGTVSVGVVENNTDLSDTQTITTSMASAVDSVSSIITSTTEKAVVLVNESIKDVFNTMKQKGEPEDHFKTYHMNDNEHSHGWLYILLGIIAGILVLIGIILLLIYIRYRKHSILPIHNYYEISPMKESCSPLSSHIQNEPEKQCSNEVYLQFST